MLRPTKLWKINPVILDKYNYAKNPVKKHRVVEPKDKLPLSITLYKVPVEHRNYHHQILQL